MKWFARWAMAAILLLSGCRRAGDAVTLEEPVTPPPMSVGTLQALGPHAFHGEVTVQHAGGEGRDRDAALELRWGGLGRWTLIETERGRVLVERIFTDGKGWARRADGMFGAASPHDAVSDLQRTIVFRDRAFAPFRSRVAWQAIPDTEIEGRRAVGFRMLLAAPAADPARPDDTAARSEGQGGDNRDLVSLEGEMWVDGSTGSRLSERWKGRYATRRGPGRSGTPGEVTVTYEEARSGIGIFPEIDPPAEGLVVDTPGTGPAVPRIPSRKRVPDGVPMAR
ncbi:hypothetical protein L6R50_18465 [Myxococcota bacterium]|nr:hypothetical protein [Myxococcota bacterium]